MFRPRTVARRLGRVSAMAILALAAAVAGPALAQQGPPPKPEPTLDLEAFDVSGNTLLQQVAIEAAVYPHLGPGRDRGDIDAARDALEKAYHDRGYQSVVVEIPAQTLSDGVVRFNVIEAPVGRLRVVGARYFSPEKIKQETASIQEGKTPDFGRTQREITELNRFPDLRVTPVLKPSRTPGLIDVDLKVDDKLPLHGSAELNNDHSQNTTDLRTVGTLRYDNLWQLGHTISGTVLIAPQNVHDAEVFAGSYLAPIWNSPWSLLAFGYYSNSNVATLGGASVLGKGYSVGARAVLQLPQVAGVSQSLTFGADYKSFKEDVSVAGQISQAPIQYVPVTAVYSLQAADTHSTTSASVTVTAGLRGFGSDANAFFTKRAFAQANFVRLNLDLDHVQHLPVGFETEARFSGQITDQPLVSTEQIAAGGRATVRGYLQAEAVGDSGWSGSLELHSPSIGGHVGKWVDEARLYAFTDAAKLWIRDPLPGQLSATTLLSAGGGARIELLEHLYGDVSVGIPLRNGAVSRSGQPYALFSVKSEF